MLDDMDFSGEDKQMITLITQRFAPAHVGMLNP
jgi:hypothetical protein